MHLNGVVVTPLPPCAWMPTTTSSTASPTSSACSTVVVPREPPTRSLGSDRVVAAEWPHSSNSTACGAALGVADALAQRTPVGRGHDSGLECRSRHAATLRTRRWTWHAGRRAATGADRTLRFRLGHRASSDAFGRPVKREGDGRSPAGVFAIGEAFGYCADRTHRVALLTHGSVQLLRGRQRLAALQPDRRHARGRRARRRRRDGADASRPPRNGDQRYRLGFVIEHNPHGVPMSGSCTSAHLWKSPVDATSGCTAMETATMDAVLAWLRPDADPVFVPAADRCLPPGWQRLGGCRPSQRRDRQAGVGCWRPAIAAARVDRGSRQFEFAALGCPCPRLDRDPARARRAAR